MRDFKFHTSTSADQNQLEDEECVDLDFIPIETWDQLGVFELRACPLEFQTCYNSFGSCQR